MAIRNPNKYRVYGLGLWGLDPEGLVITNFKIEEFDPMELAASGLEHRSGLDVGFIDPTAVIDSLYDRDNKTIYVFNEFYKSGC
jgi:phage terminase large subunit